MISMILVLNQKGDIMISRQYRYVFMPDWKQNMMIIYPISLRLLPLFSWNALKQSLE